MTWGMSGDDICSNMIYMFSHFKVWTGKQCHAYIPCQLSTHAMQKKEVPYPTRMWPTPFRPCPIILWRWGPWQRSYLWMDWLCMGWSDGLEFQMERNITGQDLSWWACIFFFSQYRACGDYVVLCMQKKSLKSFQDTEVTTCSDGTLGTKQYFTCERNKALFVPLTNCKPDSRFLFIPNENENKKPLEPPSGEAIQSAILFHF